MRKFHLARLVREKIRNNKAQSTATLRRPIRLRAEQLEERMVMSANALIAPLALPASATLAEPVFVASATARWSNAAETASQAVQSPFDRFGSAEELRALLIEAATAQWGDLFGQQAYSYGYTMLWEDAVVFDSAINIRAAAFTTSLELGAVSSTTNVQVEGVDEADLVETDGEFLYIVSGQDLVIVRAAEGEVLSVASRVHLDDTPVGMYLDGDRLAIVSSRDDFGFRTQMWIRPIQSIDFSNSLVATGIELSLNDPQLPVRTGPTTTVTVLDLTDRAQPTLVQKTEMDGRLVSSRMVDGELRLVLSKEIELPPPITKTIESEAQSEIYPPNVQSPDSESGSELLMIDRLWPGYFGTNSVYETKEEYVDRIFDEILASFDARIRSLDADGEVIADSPLLEATSIYRPKSFGAQQTTTIATFDMHGNQPGPVDTASVMTSAGAQVYATADSVYIFAEKRAEMNEMGFIDRIAPMTTSVWKLAIDGDTHSVALAAQGEFEGTLLNEFAVDERNGYLRVVTESPRWSGQGQGVTVLEEAGGHLLVVGSVTGIAANETQYSVRIIDDRVFFVTFVENIPIGDPLFVVDVSDPTNPTIMGELHIPGFSDYLEPIDETHLLAIGRNADGSGNMGELQVSIFDISDSTNPQLTQRYSFGGGSTTLSPATGNSFIRGDGDHHAVSYYADEHILALPIYTGASADGWGWIGADETPLFEMGQGGLQVFTVDVDSGFTPTGLIEHDTLINRSIRIGDRLLAISDGTVSVHNLLEPGTTLSSVDIGASAELAELKMYVAPADESASLIWTVEAALPEAGPAAVYDQSFSVEVSDESQVTPLPYIGLAPQSLASVRHAQPARAVAFSQHVPLRHIDNELVISLASETATESATSDFFIGDKEREADLDGRSHTDSQISMFSHDSVRVRALNSL